MEPWYVTTHTSESYLYTGVVLYVLVTGGMPWRLESNIVKNIDDLIAGNYEIPDFLRVSDGIVPIAKASYFGRLQGTHWKDVNCR